MTLRSPTFAAPRVADLDCYDKAVRDAVALALGAQPGWPEQLTDTVVSLVSAAQLAARQTFAVDHRRKAS